MKEEIENGEHLGHFACPSCGGSDPLSLYQKEKYIDGNCWSNCGRLKPKQLKELGVTDGKLELLVEAVTPSSRKGDFVMTDEILEKIEKISDKPIAGWPERRIPKIVNEFYGVVSDFEGEGKDKVLIKEYCPAYDQKVNVVGYHVRNDEVKKAKNNGEKVKGVPFYSVGDVRASTMLFGQNKFETNHKKVVLASGQADARAIFTTLNTMKVNSKIVLNKFITPVVSTQCGENSLAQIKANYEWLTSHEEVIIMYDNDEPGRKGAEKIAKMLKAGQAKIAKYRRKDACEHSSRGEWEEIKRAFFKAERYSPVDVIHLSEMWDDFEKEDNNVKIPFPPAFSQLNEMLGGGIERGEITVIGALTSIGKSTLVSNLCHNIMENHTYKIGAFFLEGTKREVVRDLLGLDLRENLRLKNRDNLDLPKLKNRFLNSVASKDNFVFVDHAGSINNEEIFNKLHYLAESENCDIIIFDPLQAGVNSSDNSAIIEFMDELLKFAKKTNVALVVVSHMKKPQTDNPHQVSEYDLLGSSSINQIAFNTILFSRDKMHSNSRVRNATCVKLVKCRRTGNTGDAGWVRYDVESTHFYRTDDPYENLDDDDVDISVFSDDITEQDVIDNDDIDIDNVPDLNDDDWEVVDD